MTDYATLDAELRALGEPWRSETADGEVVDRVMASVACLPAPRRRRRDVWLGRLAAWWRWAVAGVAGLLVVVVFVPPIRAAVVDWFSFGGVVVQRSPESAPTSAAGPPAIEGDLDLAEARLLVDFDAPVPRALGEPDAVEVTNERRVLSMGWDTPGGTVRLDEFNGSLAPLFVKTIYSDARVSEVRGNLALWLDQPHEIAVLDGSGSTYETQPRLAGSTLIWERGGTTLRLEGDLARQRALEIARSVRPR